MLVDNGSIGDQFQSISSSQTTSAYVNQIGTRQNLMEILTSKFDARSDQGQGIDYILRYHCTVDHYTRFKAMVSRTDTQSTDKRSILVDLIELIQSSGITINNVDDLSNPIFDDYFIYWPSSGSCPPHSSPPNTELHVDTNSEDSPILHCLTDFRSITLRDGTMIRFLPKSVLTEIHDYHNYHLMKKEHTKQQASSNTIDDNTTSHVPICCYSNCKCYFLNQVFDINDFYGIEYIGIFFDAIVSLSNNTDEEDHPISCTNSGVLFSIDNNPNSPSLCSPSTMASPDTGFRANLRKKLEKWNGIIKSIEDILLRSPLHSFPSPYDDDDLSDLSSSSPLSSYSSPSSHTPNPRKRTNSKVNNVNIEYKEETGYCLDEVNNIHLIIIILY